MLKISMHMLCLQPVAGRPEQLPAHETEFHMSRGVCSFLRIQTTSPEEQTSPQPQT